MAPTIESGMSPDIEQQPFLKYSDDGNSLPVLERGRSGQDNDASWHRYERWLKPVMSHTLVVVLTSLLWLVILPGLTSPSPSPDSSAVATTTTATPHNITTSARLLTCGASNAEAQSLGCTYDVLLNHWVPAPCQDAEAIQEYQDDDTWHGYHDANRTQRVEGGADAMSRMDFYYTSTRDHVNHCNMLWRKQFRAFFDERNFDTVIGSWRHTEHCSQFLIDVTERIADIWDEPIRTEVGWAGCWVRD